MSTRSIIALVTIALIAVFLIADTERVSPGDISRAHADLPQFAGSSDCSMCHGGLLESMAGACLDCHEGLRGQLEQGLGLHGQLDGELASRCAECHSDHHGADFDLISDRSFTEAGFSGRNGYDHRGLGYELTGSHLGLTCTECHQHADNPFIPDGSRRFAGLSQSCDACHEDVHDGELGNRCADCHGQSEPFETVSGAAHDGFAPLVGSHAELTCTECHEEDSQWSVQALVQRHGATEADVENRSCAICHETQHSEPFLAAVATTHGRYPDAQVCQHCHKADHASFLGTDAGMTPNLHAASGFELEFPHEQADCVACHAGFGDGLRPDHPSARREASSTAFPGRSADQCSYCHMDAHNGQFDEGAFADQGCLGCHERTTFSPTNFGVAHHAQTAFALTGSHEAATCQECHFEPEGQARITDEGLLSTQFAGTPTDCVDCHSTPHSTGFLAGVADLLQLAAEASCTHCHDARHDSFLGNNSPAKMTTLHVASGFELAPPHGSMRCEECHPDFEDRLPYKASPRVPSQIASASAFLQDFPGRDAQSCELCHTDPHQEQFAGSELAAQDCLSCHDSLEFRPALFGLEQHRQTSFPLTGGHEAVGCSECHVLPADSPHALTGEGLLTRIFQGTPTHCAECHTNVHGGSFDRPRSPQRVGGHESCARCHTTESFDLQLYETFDHGVWGESELLGAHATLECADCHTIKASEDPPRLDYSLLRGEQCSDCHEDRHVGQFIENGVTDCTRCHQNAETFSELVFDHQLDSRFPLDERHAELECAACHISTPLSDGSEAVRYTPLGTDCSDCHDPEGLRELEGRGR